MFDLDHKVVLITGAAGGLGRALAIEFHRRGGNLALVDIDLPGLERLSAELGARGAAGDGAVAGSGVAAAAARRQITAHCIDIADEPAVIRMRDEVLAAHQRVDIVVNNAAVSISRPFEQMSLGDLRRLFEVNYWGTVYCTKYFLPALQQQQESRLVNVISGFALMGFPGKTSYGSSKSAVMGFSYALRTELAGSGVTLCLVIPPPLNTDIVRNGLHIDEQKRAGEMRFLEKHGMPLDRAAKKIVRAVRKGRFRILIDGRSYLQDMVARLFPGLLHRIIGKRKGRIDFV